MIRRLTAPAGLLAAMLAGGLATAASLSETTLRGTVVVSDPARSLALFEFGPGNLRTLRVGAEVPGIGTLTQVGPRGVRFRTAATDIEFTFNDSALGTGGRPLGNTSTAGPGDRTAAAEAGYRQDNPQGFVMPNDGYQRSTDRAQDWLDATPRPGQSIDTTVWDKPYVPPVRQPHHATRN